MSYDLHLVPRGEDPAAAYEALEDEEEREPTPEEESALRALAADLQAANPGVDLTEPEVGFLLQLGYEAERPVVIDLAPGALTMSWSYGAADAAPALEEVARYLPVFERHGYVAYDPQLERVFELDRDAGEAQDVHRYVRGRMEEAYGPLVARPRPWWKRLTGRR